jgi:hypothetical protein
MVKYVEVKIRNIKTLCLQYAVLYIECITVQYHITDLFLICW